MNEQPARPRKILLVALLLPGSGHVLMGQPQRGLMFLFFTIVIGWASARMMPDHATFIGRHIGGVFIYGMSVIDAYRHARITWETWRHAQDNRTASGASGAPGGG